MDLWRLDMETWNAAPVELVLPGWLLDCTGRRGTPSLFKHWCDGPQEWLGGVVFPSKKLNRPITITTQKDMLWHGDKIYIFLNVLWRSANITKSQQTQSLHPRPKLSAEFGKERVWPGLVTKAETLKSIRYLYCERLKKLRKRACEAKSKQQISNFGIASHFLKLCHLCVWISMMVCPRTSHMSSRRSLQRWMGGILKFCNGLRSICLKPWV